MTPEEAAAVALALSALGIGMGAPVDPVDHKGRPLQGRPLHSWQRVEPARSWAAVARREALMIDDPV